MRHRKRKLDIFDLPDILTAVFAGMLILGVMIAPVVPDKYLGWVGVLVLPPVMAIVAALVLGIWSILLKFFG